MASAAELAMSFKRSELDSCTPLPRTSLTAVEAIFVNHGVNNLDVQMLPPQNMVILYFQDTQGRVCAQPFCDHGKGTGKHKYKGEKPSVVPGRTLALFSPLNVVQWRKNPYAYYLDNIGVIIEGRIGSKQEDRHVNVQDLEWIDIKAVNWSRIGALTEEKRGTWVYYESGRAKGIREIWKGVGPGTSTSQPQYKFTTFPIPELLNGTDIAAVQIPTASSGSFFYQHEDFSLWEHNWNNTTFKWDVRMVLAASPSDPSLSASPLTALSAAFNPLTNKIHVHYLTVENQLGVVVRMADSNEWQQPKPLPTERIIPGSRLGATSAGEKVFVAFQVDHADLHGLYYSSADGI